MPWGLPWGTTHAETGQDGYRVTEAQHQTRVEVACFVICLSLQSMHRTIAYHLLAAWHDVSALFVSHLSPNFSGLALQGSLFGLPLCRLPAALAYSRVHILDVSFPTRPISPIMTGHSPYSPTSRISRLFSGLHRCMCALDV